MPPNGRTFSSLLGHRKLPYGFSAGQGLTFGCLYRFPSQLSLPRSQKSTPSLYRASHSQSQLQTRTPRRNKNNPTIMADATDLKGQPLDKAALDSVLRRRMFFTPSFEVWTYLAGRASLREPLRD